MIDKEKLKAKCNELLNPLGYSIHISTQQSWVYSNNKPDPVWPWPLIECVYYPDGEMSMNLIMSGKIGLLQGTIKELQFAHPQLKEFIAKLRYYSNCIQSASSNPLAKHYIKNLIQETL